MWYPASEISDSLHPYIDNDIKLKYIAEQLDVSQKIVKLLRKKRWGVAGNTKQAVLFLSSTPLS